MLSEQQASDIKFAGLGVNAASAATAAEQLAAGLRDWVAARAGCRLLQLSVLPAVPGAVPETIARGDAYGAMAIIAYVDDRLPAAAAAQAVAAAVEEIHEAQVAEDEPATGLPPQVGPL